MPTHPPDLIDAGLLGLRRATPADVEAMSVSVAENLDHLVPWMPWATPEAGTLVTQRRRLAEVDAAWRAGEEFNYLAVSNENDAILGRFGLHRRIGPGALELGYWLCRKAVGHGYATAGARALTAAARLDRIELGEVEASAEAGRSMIWVFPPDAR